MLFVQLIFERMVNWLCQVMPLASIVLRPTVTDNVNRQANKHACFTEIAP